MGGLGESKLYTKQDIARYEIYFFSCYNLKSFLFNSVQDVDTYSFHSLNLARWIFIQTKTFPLLQNANTVWNYYSAAELLALNFMKMLEKDEFDNILIIFFSDIRNSTNTLSTFSLESCYFEKMWCAPK